MALTLTDVRRIAADVAQQQHPLLDVIGVTKREGSSSSAEVIFTVRECNVEPCRVVVGVSRHASEPECRTVVHERLAAQLKSRITD